MTPELKEGFQHCFEKKIAIWIEEDFSLQRSSKEEKWRQLWHMNGSATKKMLIQPIQQIGVIVKLQGTTRRDINKRRVHHNKGTFMLDLKDHHDEYKKEEPLEEKLRHLSM